MRTLQRHLSYANVVATLALLFAMSGGALAASRYLITKTSQIKPSVIKKLKTPGKTGASGATGTAGATGAAGAKGATGAQGLAGPAGPSTGPAGGALSGTYPDPGLAALPAITAITKFYSGWSDFKTADPVGYYVDGFGIVHLTGAITGGTAPGYAFELPAADGSTGAEVFAAGNLSGPGSSGKSVACSVTVYSTGGVYIQEGCSSGFVSLEGITYRPG